MTTWPDLLTRLVKGEDLSGPEVRWAMGQVLAGEASPVHIAAFAVALRAKGEKAEEISACAEAMLEVATPITLDREAVDIVGTGADRANTVNVSTMAAVVVAAAGAKVVKHGSRAASSACGAADVLEAVGLALDLRPEQQAEVLRDDGVVFLFAPLYHASLRHAATTRRELGIATTFNFLGPLANPARPHAHAVGVADLRMAGLMAEVLAARGGRGLVFHGDDGLDELTTTTTSRVWLVRDGQLTQDEVDPAGLGLAPATISDLVGGAPDHNARVMRSVLGGEPGAVRDIVLLNAAAALVSFHGPDPGRSINDQLADRLGEAAAAVDSGAATRLLWQWAEHTQRLRVA